jgi:GH15 family glucan-1,4-alpha-glucosidase
VLTLGAPEAPGGYVEVMRSPVRNDGYAPIRDYAALGNRRTAALVALDGSIDWLPLPAFDKPGVCAALLDARKGGRFELKPDGGFEAERRYIPDTNVLETVFATAGGKVRVTDALALPGVPTLPWTELSRRIEGLAGSVEMRWSVQPRFEWIHEGEIEFHHGTPVICHRDDALAVQSFDAGEPVRHGAGVSGSATLAEGERALLAVGAFHSEPILLSPREDVERRLDETVRYWANWAKTSTYEGPWRDAVMRSMLALGLCVYVPTGAIVAAPTTSLPEKIGGSRNYDYRYGWMRDTNYTLDAMLQLGFATQVHGTLSWVLGAAATTHPHLRPFFKLDASYHPTMTELPLEGYRGSAPVNEGNDAESQLQLGNYGDLFDTAWRYVEDGNGLDPGSRTRLAEVADFLCGIWRNPDSGIWELSELLDYTQSKLACWIAMDRALKLADEGQLPDSSADKWRATRDQVREYIETHCWSEQRGAYTRAAGSDQLDAGVLMAARVGYFDLPDPRLDSTIAAVRSELGRGPLLYRYSGMEEKEGAFLACSFWLVEALAGSGRMDEAAEMMDELVSLANDVGLLSEEIDPDSNEMLGNIPQALSHLTLINAACALTECG